MAKNTSRSQMKKYVIDALNSARAMELGVITQYMNHHYNLDNMDYGEMAANMKLIAIDEMRHAEKFAERIKELGGEPTMAPAAKSKPDGTVMAIFKLDAAFEDGAIDAYNRFLLICRDNGDSSSVKLFEEIIEEEQLHFNYFDNVRQHIDNLGETYLAQVAGTSSATGIVYQGFAARQGGGTAAGA